jgi:hypothetical protein
MHLTLKLETTKPAGKNFLQQQAGSDRFIDSYNVERPHQAIGMRSPAELYRPSTRPYHGLPVVHGEVKWRGWASTKQAAIYTRKANRAKMEAEAAPLLAGRKSNESVPLFPVASSGRTNERKKA